MKASYHLLAVVLLAGVAAAADPPANTFLLLDDFRVVEGQVERFGKLLRVTAGGKQQIFNDFQVLHQTTTREDVYKYVTERAETGTAAGRVKLAEWFLKVGEPLRAGAEARAAAELAPTETKVQELVKRCEQESAKARTAQVRAEPSGGRKPPEPANLRGLTPPARETAVVAPEAAKVFAARIQPILMNSCAKCHAAKGYEGGFTLDRVPEGYANPAAAAVNLTAAVKQLAAADPANSPLLVQALSAHGGAKLPPLANREHPAFRNLEAWAYAAIGPPKPAAVAATEPATPAMPVAAAPASKPAVAQKPEPVAQSKSNPAGPPPAANPNDPFDPAVFNRNVKERR